MLKALNLRNAVGLDNSHEAIRYCAEKGLGKVEYGDLCALPFENGRFDLVLATDVIEHVDDDGKALTEVARVLKPGGTAVITVPAFQSLWGVADEVGHHKRRYRRAQLAARIHAAGLECPELFYFNYLLFLPIWLARQIIRIRGIRVENENQVNTPLLNRILTAIFSLDVWSARYVRPPFGVSILALAQTGANTAKEN
jgi:SAM-dependent methyltransferase